jgi:hypothetical protein
MGFSCTSNSFIFFDFINHLREVAKKKNPVTKKKDVGAIGGIKEFSLVKKVLRRVLGGWMCEPVSKITFIFLL